MEALRAPDGRPLQFVDAAEGDHGGPDGGYSSFHDADTSAEVDAAFRSQRRIAAAYLVVFVVVLATVALGTVSLSWATSGPVLAGFSPSFLAIGFGLYVFFVAIGIAAASLANGVDDRMLGADSLTTPPTQPAETRPNGR